MTCGLKLVTNITLMSVICAVAVKGGIIEKRRTKGGPATH